MNNIFYRIVGRWLQVTQLNQYKYNSASVLGNDKNETDFIFRSLDAGDFGRHPIFQEKDRKRRYLKHLENGHHCYGFESPSGDIAAYLWLTRGELQQPMPNPAFRGFSWLIGHNEAYIWDCRTAPAYQRQGLYREGLKRLVSICLEQGRSKIMISCKPDNTASHLAIQSVGFELKGITLSITTAIFKWIRCSGRTAKLFKSSTPVTTRDVFPWS